MNSMTKGAINWLSKPASQSNDTSFRTAYAARRASDESSLPGEPPRSAINTDSMTTESPLPDGPTRAPATARTTSKKKAPMYTGYWNHRRAFTRRRTHHCRPLTNTLFPNRSRLILDRISRAYHRIHTIENTRFSTIFLERFFPS